MIIFLPVLNRTRRRNDPIPFATSLTRSYTDRVDAIRRAIGHKIADAAGSPAILSLPREGVDELGAAGVFDELQEKKYSIRFYPYRGQPGERVTMAISWDRSAPLPDRPPARVWPHPPAPPRPSTGGVEKGAIHCMIG